MQIGTRNTGGLVKITLTSGGAGYSSPPTVSISGGGGAGASAVAHMAGTQVESVVVTAGGTGFTSSPTISFSGGGGSGAAATAYAHTGPLRPMTLFKGRYNDLYGVDGMGRGIQWDGAAASVSPIGIIKPSRPPAVTASTTGYSGRVTSVHVVRSGSGYGDTPAIVFVGTASSTASARAAISNGRVSGITLVDGGLGYSSPPVVQINGGRGDGATFSVGVIGEVDSIDVYAGGSGYTSSGSQAATSVTFYNTNGLANARGTPIVNQNGQIESIFINSVGTGATTTGVTATVAAGTGGGAGLIVNMSYRVASVTASSTGAGYYAPPIITFLPSVDDPTGDGAAATAIINSAGNVTGATVYAGGRYEQPPTAQILDTSALALATITQPLRGKYQCCVRYIVKSSAAGFERASSISDITEIDVGEQATTITWNITHTTVDDRVTHMELWRTSGDQAVILFRVATIARTSGAWSAAYADSLDDAALVDPTRNGYGLLPITLPSGQVNARRFDVPPAEFAVACMFQDRAWYAVDVTGERPNSLLFSEVDEPESVPEVNELVLQENTGSPDQIVALIPFASQLLVAQSSHIYSLTYVAQPVLDAAMRLVAYRGVLNARCWDVMGGIVYIVDSHGMYAFDGSEERAMSVAVDNYWRDGIIDFSKSSQFHVCADAVTKTVRFFYCQTSDSAPVRALCYGLATQAWWEEQYATAVTAACDASIGGRHESINGLANGSWTKNKGASDTGTGIAYLYRSGPMALKDENGSRSIGLLYKPTATTASVGLRLHYNNSPTPRANAVASNRGDGFTTDTGSTEATLNMSAARSPLGSAVGFARAYFSGRAEERSAGADRHAAIAIAGTQPTNEQVVLYGITVEGMG